MTMIKFFHVSVKPFQDRLTPFDIKIAFLFKEYSLLQSAHHHHWSQLCSSNIKGCRSNKKQFSIDSFLDWEGHQWFFTHSFIQLTPTLSRPQHDTRYFLHSYPIFHKTNIFWLDWEAPPRAKGGLGLNRQLSFILNDSIDWGNVDAWPTPL